MSLFCCPLCAAPLTRGDHAYTCPGGHSFDLAAAGYVHLLPANRKHSQNPGDDKAMVAARSDFLDRGYYAPLRDAPVQAGPPLRRGPPRPRPAGQRLRRGLSTPPPLSGPGRRPRPPRPGWTSPNSLPGGPAAEGGGVRRGFGVPAPPLARARRPADQCVLPCAPRNLPGSCPGGHFLYVVPSPRHLWEMKQVLYDRPYENGVKREDYPGFRWLEAVPLRYSVHLDRSEDVMALFGMTPYAWKTPRAGVARLKALTELDTEIGFDIHVYERTEE